ncbi:MAG: S9 family peptidase [Verrucomicrobia bacterium]|nr:S9 family peptidase [Verrucomicrobiota bacterium]
MRIALLSLVLLPGLLLAENPQPAASPAGTPAAGKSPITHQKLWLLKRVGAPVPSPDGRWAVFSVVEPSYEHKDQITDLWLKSLTDDTPARKITHTKAAEGGVVWSKDSQRLAFSAKREGDEQSQLYVLDLARGGEAERVTSLTLGARQPKWSPDGKSLLFVSDFFPNCADEEANKKAAKERKERKYNVRVYDTYPPRFWDQWRDDKKTHLFVQEAKSGAKAKSLFTGTKFIEQKGIGGRQDEAGEIIDAEWAPDGAKVVFVVGVNRDEAARNFVRSQIFEVALTGGEPRNLTDDQRSYRGIHFTPNGKTLLCLTNEERKDQVFSLSRLASFPWPFEAAKRAILTASFDRNIGRYAVPEGSDRVWFTCEHAGFERLHSVALAGGPVREEAARPTGCLTGLAAAGRQLVANWEDATQPPELHALGADGKEFRRLTSFNVEEIAKLDLPSLEHFWFTSKRGRKIHNMILRPPGLDPTKKYPLFTVIHGGAANMWRDAWVLRWNYHLLSAPGYAVLLTDYSGSDGYGEAFGQSIKGDPLKGPADELNEAVDEALKKYAFLDPSRLAAGGASYGGHLANWLQATTTRYRCIISHAGEMDLIMQWGTSDSQFGREVNSGGPPWDMGKVWFEQSPVLQAANHAKGTGFKSPILITIGELDYRVPLNNALMNFATQQRLGVTSKLLVFPEENHWIRKGEESRFWFDEVHGWLARWLK